MRIFHRWTRLGLVIIPVVFLLAAPQVSAQGEFHVSLHAEYTIQTSGETLVRQQFTLKNNVSDVYASKYGLELQSNNLKNIRISYLDTLLPATINATEQKTTIGITFPDRIVGKDQSRQFTVEYLDPDLALISGEVLELYVPRLAQPGSFQEYIVSIKVPNQYGQPAIVHPEDFSIGSIGDSTVLTFSNQGKEEGITAFFGDEQRYQFTLQYHLENVSGNQGVAQITLPPDLARQQFVYQLIEPSPESVEADADGNWIATYRLESLQKMTITAEGIARIFLKPTINVPVFSNQTIHTKQDEYWPIDDQLIKNVASSVRTPAEIFQFVVNTLEYNYSRTATTPERFGASRAIQDPNNALCQEYTDLFITLARANRIPARRVIGYAQSQNSQLRPSSLIQDVLHAWPEYFEVETQSWIPVDPTWGDTTGGVDYFSRFGFQHLGFVVQGVNSQSPYPAGAYRQTDSPAKNISVTATTNLPDLSWKANVSVKEPLAGYGALFQPHRIVIKNLTGRAWYDVPLELTVPDGWHAVQVPQSIELLLPYQTVEIPIFISARRVLHFQSGTITVRVEGEEYALDVRAAPGISQLAQIKWYLLGGAIGGAIAFLGVIVWKKWRIIQKKKLKKVTSIQTQPPQTTVDAPPVQTE